MILALWLVVSVPTSWNQIGIAAWCAVDTKEKSIQCNYDTRNECESYNSTCAENPNYPITPVIE